MRHTARLVLYLALLGATAAPAPAFPVFLQMFQTDPLRRPEVDGCATCHVDPHGGGPRNEFGLAFAANQMQITPMLRAQFPDRFVYPTSRIGGGTAVHFTDPENASLVMEVDGQRYLVDLESRSVPGSETGGPESPARTVAAAPGSTIRPVDSATSEGAFFGPRIVDLPNGKGMGAGDVEFLIGHRFSQPLFPILDNGLTSGSIDNLFGFDSSAFVTFGAEVGLTDWVSVAGMRSNLDRTVEIASGFQLSSQDSGPGLASSAPLSTRLRVGVEGRNNFQDRFAPFAQLVVARSFGDRFSFAVAPGIAFNTRNEDTFLPREFLFGADKDYTASVGVGAGLRVLPTVSVVAEYVPRVAGFRGEVFDRPAVSVGIQKATFRHTFEFVISTARPLTTAQYTVNGSDSFKVGFNIYRRLR